MSDLVDSVVGDYRLVEFLGSGGMGEVYRAVHSKIGRAAAVKVLTSAASDSDFEERFLNEARIQAELQHPNIATLYEFTEIRGLPCIVMEYVDGDTLADRIRRAGRMPAAEALAVFRPVVDAIAYIHARGVVHRDIKAHNIKVASDGAVKLLDFGIAKGSATPKLTQAGQFVGTLHYCSPEQLHGRPVDHRSDIWALGVLLYEMVSGCVPFDAPSVGEFVSQVECGEFRPPSQLVSDVPPAVDEIVNGCLRRRPERRYQSGEQLRDAIADALDGGSRRQGGPALSRLAQHLEAAVEFARGHLAIVGGAAALLLVLVLVLAVFIGGSRSDPEPARDGPAAGAQARQQPVSIGMVGGRAEVWVDGRRVGQTPCRFSAPVGRQLDVELRLGGHRPLRRTIEVLPHSNSYTYSARDFERR